MRRVLLALMAVGGLSFFAHGAFAQDAPPPPPGRGPGGGRGMGAPKNLKILKPEDIRPVMGAFVAGTGLKCDGCHAVPDFASDDKKEKVIARKMLEMVNGINANTFNGDNKVTCYTCHRGEAHPLTDAPAK